MLHTKTKPGTYDEHDYWIVTYTDIRGEEPVTVVREYDDVDNAYEDYCRYRRWARNCEYRHERR